MDDGAVAGIVIAVIVFAIALTVGGTIGTVVLLKRRQKYVVVNVLTPFASNPIS